MLLAPTPVLAHFDEDQAGAWYMYMWTVNRENSRSGFQSDIQHRNWGGGDLEQLLVYIHRKTCVCVRRTEPFDIFQPAEFFCAVQGKAGIFSLSL